MDNTNESILTLIAAQLCGEDLTEQEKQELAEWKAVKPENQNLFEYYQDLFQRKEKLQLFEGIAFNQQITEHIFASRKSRKFYFMSFAKYAAVIIPMLILSLWFLWQQSGNKPNDSIQIVNIQNDVAPGQQKAQLKLENGEIISLSDSRMVVDLRENIQVENGGVLQYASTTTQMKAVYHTLVVDRGSEFQLILPDGTKVWLNSDSELKYPNVFNDTTRKVYLKGEAYFEVKHSENQPFIVTAGHCAIRVLGTEFNVSSYEEENQVLTTLIQGKVAYQAGKTKGELTPGEQCIYDKGEKSAIVKKVDVDQYVSWKNGLFIFDRIRMDELAKQISRWYNVEVLFPDDKTREVCFSGAMERYKPVSYVIQMLNETNTVDCQLHGNILEFRKK